ncbi:Hpt domain-containing protein [Synechocystis sp. LKSZ1]|uniref:Hpt domain-containing protein n=1 Tax=Synechocystis sp. LKSZ1 TaxID=3144951 RepID=UPI00336BC06A
MDQQKILGYFIEEAKEHLETLERGILELTTVIDDQERLNEMFRAAHSVKGGAAMLGYTSIQKTAHRLEDAFKILREHRVSVDQKLESLFLKGYDILQDLVEKLQSPQGLQADEADSIVEGAHQQFEDLQNYLNYLLTQGETSAPKAEVAPSPPTPAPAPTTNAPQEIKSVLRKMLQGFKQEVSPTGRQALQELCASLAPLAPRQNRWQDLVQLAGKAIANPRHSYRTLAPVVLKDLKQGCDYIELEQTDKIAPSPGLKQLAEASLPQVLVPADPQGAARILLQVFNPQQVNQLVQLLAQSH